MIPSLNEAEISSIVEAGGGKYIGVLKEVPEKTEMIVLFISRETKSTLGIPISRLTAEAARKQLAESNAAFGKRSMPEETKFTGRSKRDSQRSRRHTARDASAFNRFRLQRDSIPPGGVFGALSPQVFVGRVDAFDERPYWFADCTLRTTCRLWLQSTRINGLKALWNHPFRTRASVAVWWLFGNING